MSNIAIDKKLEDLTSEEQEFVELLTDKLIEVAGNPSMRKEFIVQAPVLEQYRFFKSDIPSEIEHIALFRFNFYNDNYERALLWAEQVKDEFINHYMLSVYYRYCALEAPATEKDTQSLFLQSLEHGYGSFIGIPYALLAEYAEYLMRSKNEMGLIELATAVFAVGLHYSMNPADPNVFYTFNQLCTKEEVKVIERMLQVIKEYAENGSEDTKDLFMNFYHLESAYYYACTGRIQLAKKEIALFAGGNEKARDLYNFNNLTDEEREKRHEDLNAMSVELHHVVLEQNTEHFQRMKQYAIMAFGFKEPPKRPRPQKGSFDWLYNQAEKSYLAILNHKATERDYANLRTLSEAYRTGNGVRQNLRLADCWEEMASL